ncbi:MAG: cyclic nucleotide-binding domain-containing protein [Rhodospirillaceae bacterium]
MLNHYFRNLTDAERPALMQAVVARRYKGGEALFNQGDLVDNLMVLASDMLRVAHVFDGRLSEFVGPLGPGDVVGEMSFVDGKPVSATLIADGDTEVLSNPWNAIDALMAKDSSFASQPYKDLLLHLAHRLRATNLRADPGPGSI